MPFPTLDELIGNTLLVKLQRLSGTAGNTVLAKLEGNNPAGSVKDRPALGMIRGAEERGELKPGDTLIEATSGNIGIALAMELSQQEGIFAGVSSGGAMSVALRLSRELRDAVIVTVICDRADRYLSTGLFDKS